MMNATTKGTNDGKACNMRNAASTDKRTAAAAWFTSSGLEFTDDNRRAYVKAFLASMG
jgi:hypothetical protein